MALSNMAVFSEFLQTSMTEVLAQKIDLFNASSQGTIVLQGSPVEGDYSDKTLWAKIDGIVRRRNAYGSGAVTSKTLQQLTDTMVKLAAGTPPIEFNPSQMTWIQKSPEEAGVVIGRQLAVATMQDMLNAAILAGTAAMSNVAAVVYDGSAAKVDPTALLNGVRKFGDRSNAIAAWIMHSNVVHDYYADNLANTERLFNYGTVNVIGDAFGRVFVVSDSPNLVEADGVSAGIDKYSSLGLTTNALTVTTNADFDDATEKKTGDENIKTVYQAEWTYNLGIKGYAWDKTNGGASPNDAAVGTGTNWDLYVSDIKDSAGVVVQTR